MRTAYGTVLFGLLAWGLLSLFSLEAKGQEASRATPAEYCSGKKFKDLSFGYDPVIDSTRAQVSYRLKTGWLNETVNVFLIDVSHAGKSSDSVLTLRLWVAASVGEMPLQSRINLLVDDSVRYSWVAPLEVPDFKGNGAIYGMGMVDLQWMYFPVKAEEFRRFATAKRATVVIHNRRYELKDKDFAPFIEILRWAECPIGRGLAESAR